MEILSNILNWDGKSVKDISKIYDQFSAQNEFTENIIKALTDTNLQSGATWLLKRYMSEGGTLHPNLIVLIYKYLPLLDHWESKLHILQSMEYMPIPTNQKKVTLRFLRASLKDQNKLVRAWAYNGFHLFAHQFHEYKEERDKLFSKAINNEAASVKARIRNILKAS
ncbi:hypothetical protein [Kiloniella sp.]|uniref:hypothetical protein n=1 Tax=Kiloniella sp. TaxID=1938587 RepID=UPI003B02B0D5